MHPAPTSPCTNGYGCSLATECTCHAVSTMSDAYPTVAHCSVPRSCGLKEAWTGVKPLPRLQRFAAKLCARGAQDLVLTESTQTCALPAHVSEMCTPPAHGSEMCTPPANDSEICASSAQDSVGGNGSSQKRWVCQVSVTLPEVAPVTASAVSADSAELARQQAALNMIHLCASAPLWLLPD